MFSKSKMLCEQMTLADAEKYIKDNPRYRLPGKPDTFTIKYNKVHIGYWLNYMEGDRQAICLGNGKFSRSHHNIKRNVILIKD